MIEWNSLLTALNHYLAELYSDAPGYDSTRRVLRSAGVNTARINFTGNALDTWYRILDHIRLRNKELLIDLLKAVTDPKEGYDKDEFLLSAIRNLEQDTLSVEGSEADDNGWKSKPLEKSTKEKIIGKKSNLLPITFLEKGLAAAPAVVRAVVGKELGTGFLILNNWFVTNNHVIDSIEKAKTARIQFNYQYRKGENDSIELSAEHTGILNPGNTPGDRLFFTNPTEDWTLVKLSDDLFGKYKPLRVSELQILIDDHVNIIQHPSGGAKQLAVYDNTVMYSDDNVVQYLTDTMPGSSGSPVFNSDWEVVAIHHSGGWITEPLGGKKYYRNQGTNFLKVMAFMKENNLLNA